MGNRNYQRRLSFGLAICISLALLLSPITTFAAPPASALLQTSVYEDPDGFFQMAVPDSFSGVDEVTFEMLADNELDDLLTSWGIVFSVPDSPNGVSALFLLFDETIVDETDFAAFLAAFQTAAGGETLRLVDLELVDGDDLRAVGRAATRDRHLQVDIRAKDNVAAIVSASVERSQYSEYRGVLSEAFDSFTWEPEIVQTELASAAGLLPEEPVAEEDAAEEQAPESDAPEEPTSSRRTGEQPVKGQRAEPDSSDAGTQDEDAVSAEPTEAESEEVEPAEAETSTNQTTTDRAQTTSTESELFSDANSVFSVSLPAGLRLEDLSDAETALYGFDLTDEETGQLKVAIGFTPAAYAAQGAEGEITFEEVDDEVWNAFIDEFIIADLGDLTVITDERDDWNRTAFLVLRSEEGDENNPPEVWVWLEESDGVGAAIAIIGERQDPINGEIFHDALTTFVWNPGLAASSIADLADVPDPFDAPVALDDPFGLLQASTPPDLRFEKAMYLDGAIEYLFGRDSLIGASQIILLESETGPVSDENWAIAVAEQEETLPSILNEGEANPTARLISSEQDLPFLDADHSAFIQVESDDFWSGLIMMEKDGVIAIQNYTLTIFFWELFEDVILDAIEVGIDYDPDAVRETLAANAESGATIVDTAAVSETPQEEEEYEPTYIFDPMDGFTLAISFEEPDLDGSLKAIVRSDVMPEYPLVQYALWLGEEQLYATEKMTSQNENGTQAAFIFSPDYPMNNGDYIAEIYYDNVLTAALAFSVWSSEPEDIYVMNFAAAYSDDVVEPLVRTTAIHPADVVTMRGQANIPAGSQIRLFWYDPDGWLLTNEVATIRLDESFYSPFDWIYFEPEIDWQQGYYSWSLTVDGESIEEGQLFVVEESEPVQLTADGAEIYGILPIPPEMATPEESDFIDFIIEPTSDVPSVDIISAIDATLRWQGWKPALPPIGAPVAFEHRRWTKDGYQFVVEQGVAEFDNELWLTYTTVDDRDFGPLPSGDELDVTSVKTIDSVAVTEIADKWVEDAVISPDGHWLAVVTSDGTLYIFDTHRMLDSIWFQPNGYYARPVFSPDSRDLAVTVELQNRSEVQIFSNFDIIWLPTTRLNGHTNQVTDIVFQPDGWLASGGVDGSLRYWDLLGEYGPYMVEMDESITGLAAAPEETPGLLVGKVGGWIDFVLDSPEEAWSDLGTLTESPRIAAWTQLDEEGVGDLIVFGQQLAEWYLYDEEVVEFIADLPEDNADFRASSAAFSNNGELIAIAGPYVSFVDRQTGESLGDWTITIDEEETPILNISFSADNRFVVVADDLGYLRLWAVPAQ